MEKIKQIEKYASDYNIPIMQKSGINFLTKYINENNDALDINLEDKYDLIFIDAAKGQYIRFFEKYKKNLNKNGVIISDNMEFHGLVEQEERIESKNLRQLVNHIRDYISFLKDNTEFNTIFYKVGDGISVSSKNE